MKNWERSFPNKSPWTREEVVRLRELLNDGVPFDEIVVEDVYLTEDQFEKLPDFEGF